MKISDILNINRFGINTDEPKPYPQVIRYFKSVELLQLPVETTLQQWVSLNREFRHIITYSKKMSPLFNIRNKKLLRKDNKTNEVENSTLRFYQKLKIQKFS